MRNSVFTSLMMLALMAISLFMSCEKDSDITSSVVDIDNFVDSTMYDMQRDANCGKHGCYELVFPIVIAFPDSTTAEVESYEDLRETLYTWKEGNPEVEGRPQLTFPIEVLDEDGEIISVGSLDELKDLGRLCGRKFFRKNGPRGHRNRAKACFKLVFPLSIAFADGTTSEAADRGELKRLVRAWFEANGRDADRPEVVFPVTVEYEDGSTAVANSKEELRALKEECASDD